MITITPNAPAVPGPSPTSRFQQNGPPHIRFQNNSGRQNFFQPFRAYRQPSNGPLIFDPEFDGKRLRKSAMRKTVDYNAAIIKMLEARVWQRDFRDRRSLQPDAMYIPDLMPPSAYEDNPINAVTTRFVKTATNKMRCPIFCMAWTPEGRRLVTGASSGEFTLWNGLTFNFETILQAHDTPVRTMVWSHNELWMVTADHAGYVKYWQSNMNNVKMFMAHQDAIRGISFSPGDSKFASCSDDGTIKIWDFYRCQEERTLRGHGADVKCVHWHPQKALIISGSKDNQQPVKLWDPKSGVSLSTIHAHKSTVMDIKWNDNGNWFVTSSRDHLLKLFDVRKLNTEVQVFRGHKKEASCVGWHPVHEGLFASGGSDGAILFWHVGAEKEVGAIEQAHDSIVWTLAWHPMGHILCSGSNDHTSKFWTRNRPGDSMRDKYNLNTVPASLAGIDDQEIDEVESVIPGMGPEDKVEAKDTPLPGLTPGAIPGLDVDIEILPDEKGRTSTKKVPYSKPIPKNFQAQWNESGKLDDIDEGSRDGLDPMTLINKLIEQQPGVKLVKDLEPTQLLIYGKVLDVEPGSVLFNTIREGSEKLLKYLNSGAVKEIRDVIPHYDDNTEVFFGDEEEDDGEDPMDENEWSRMYSDSQDVDDRGMDVDKDNLNYEDNMNYEDDMNYEDRSGNFGPPSHRERRPIGGTNSGFKPSGGFIGGFKSKQGGDMDVEQNFRSRDTNFRDRDMNFRDGDTDFGDSDTNFREPFGGGGGRGDYWDREADWRGGEDAREPWAGGGGPDDGVPDNNDYRDDYDDNNYGGDDYQDDYREWDSRPAPPPRRGGGRGGGRGGRGRGGGGGAGRGGRGRGSRGGGGGKRGGRKSNFRGGAKFPRGRSISENY